MQIVIDVPKQEYNILKNLKIPMTWAEHLIAKGVPLDDVKAVIAEEICLTDNPYTKETKYTIEHLKLLEILDNIFK